MLDLVSIQECLSAYEKLIRWLPCSCSQEEDMKDDRIRTVRHLIHKCEKIIREEGKSWVVLR